MRSITDCSACALFADEAYLTYWHTTTDSYRFNETEIPTITQPITAVIDGITFTSPSVYLSFDSIFSTDDRNSDIWSLTNVITSLDPNELSSVDYDGNSRSFNFADLDGPVPSSILSEECEGNPISECQPLIDVYYPFLSIPPDQVRDLDPRWKYCEVALYGIYDPPRLLVPASVLVDPTPTPNKPANLPVWPAATVGPQGAKNTGKVENPLANSDPEDRNPPAHDPPPQSPSSKLNDPPEKSLSTEKNHSNGFLIKNHLEISPPMTRLSITLLLKIILSKNLP